MVAGLPGYVAVVYHLVPTSNHNSILFNKYDGKVVYHLVPTSNHNYYGAMIEKMKLFIILFLHQTTTSRMNRL